MKNIFISLSVLIFLSSCGYFPCFGQSCSDDEMKKEEIQNS